MLIRVYQYIAQSLRFRINISKYLLKLIVLQTTRRSSKSVNIVLEQKPIQSSSDEIELIRKIAHTCLAVGACVSSNTRTCIAIHSVGTCSFMLAWIACTLVNICKNQTTRTISTTQRFSLVQHSLHSFTLHKLLCCFAFTSTLHNLYDSK